MKPVNLPSGAQRNAEVGLVWQQVYSGAGGTTLTVLPQATIRVSAGADVTVTIGGVLAATLRSGEVEYFNSGVGPDGDLRTTVQVVIGAGDARVQVALESENKGRRTK